MKSNSLSVDFSTLLVVTLYSGLTGCSRAFPSCPCSCVPFVETGAIYSGFSGCVSASPFFPVSCVPFTSTFSVCSGKDGWVNACPFFPVSCVPFATSTFGVSGFTSGVFGTFFSTTGAGFGVSFSTTGVVGTGVSSFAPIPIIWEIGCFVTSALKTFLVSTPSTTITWVWIVRTPACPA